MGQKIKILGLLSALYTTCLGQAVQVVKSIEGLSVGSSSDVTVTAMVLDSEEEANFVYGYGGSTFGIAHVDNSGELEWDITIGGDTDIFDIAVSPTDNSVYAITHTADSLVVGGIKYSIGENSWILHFSSTGTFLSFQLIENSQQPTLNYTTVFPLDISPIIRVDGQKLLYTAYRQDLNGFLSRTNLFVQDLLTGQTIVEEPSYSEHTTSITDLVMVGDTLFVLGIGDKTSISNNVLETSFLVKYTMTNGLMQTDSLFSIGERVGTEQTMRYMKGKLYIELGQYISTDSLTTCRIFDTNFNLLDSLLLDGSATPNDSFTNFETEHRQFWVTDKYIYRGTSEIRDRDNLMLRSSHIDGFQHSDISCKSMISIDSWFSDTVSIDSINYITGTNSSIKYVKRLIENECNSNNQESGTLVIGKIYPNPTQDKFRVENQVGELQIRDIQGKIVLQKNILLGEEIDIETLSKDIYMVEVRQGAEVKIREILIKK